MKLLIERHKAARNNPNREVGKIVFDKKTEVRKKRGKPGRPRKYPANMPLAQRYIGYRGGKSIPTCANKGCYKELRIGQPLVCSDSCWQAVFTRSMHTLIKLEVTKKQILDYLAESRA